MGMEEYKSKKSAIITQSAKETQEFAKEFAKKIRSGTILTLYGDLGSGKTTFTQGLAEGLGVKERIISPTFIIVRNYESKNFYHIDLYRIETEKDLEGLGVEDILNDKKNFVVIEWAEKLGDLLPDRRIDIRFEHVDENKRRIIIHGSN